VDVLVVEDEPLVREAVAAVLRGAGFGVAEAASAEEALALAGSAGHGGGGAAPAVVVADLRLGAGMDGLALGAEARRRWPGVGVVYATGHPDGFDGRLLGPRERYVLKPFAPAALLSAVRRLTPPRLLGLPLQ
jgi:CheY-like chemotaxis protein